MLTITLGVTLPSHAEVLAALADAGFSGRVSVKPVGFSGGLANYAFTADRATLLALLTSDFYSLDDETATEWVGDAVLAS